MTDPKIVLIVLLVLCVCASASKSYFRYPSNFPIVIFTDFKYIPTDYGYKLSYRTLGGVSHEELGIVPGVPPLNNNDNDNTNSGDTLGSSRAGRLKSKRLPLKNRKVSPKLLASLSG